MFEYLQTFSVPRVTRVSFEGEPEDSDLLVVYGVEHSIDH